MKKCNTIKSNHRKCLKFKIDNGSHLLKEFFPDDVIIVNFLKEFDQRNQMALKIFKNFAIVYSSDVKKRKVLFSALLNLSM